MNQSQPSYLNFDKENYFWKPDVDYRKQQVAYRVGKGEQGTGDAEKAESAAIFYEKWKAAESNAWYTKAKSDWKNKFG